MVKAATTLCMPSPHLEAGVRAILANAGVSSVVAGISGGADSVAMLLALANIGVNVIALHCNFHLRGQESDRDQIFVEHLCKDLDIPLHIVHVDVANLRSVTGNSVEMVCRDSRYEAFRSLMHSVGADRIAVAHNSDDQAETLLLNLMRGSGVSGLRAMLPDTGEIIRPLLALSRKDILDYLSCAAQEFMTDSTNLESDYSRNFIRNNVMPLLRERWPGASAAICKTASIMAQEERALAYLESKFVGVSANKLSFEAMSEWGDPMWAIRRFAAPLGANLSQCEEICRTVMACDYTPGKHWITPSGKISAERGYLEFIPECRDGGIANNPCVSGDYLEVDKHELSDDIWRMVLEAPLSELWTTLPPDAIMLRHVHVGDRIKALGMSGSTLVSKIMKDAKLTRAQKLDVRVVVHIDSGEIIWVQGLKRSSLFLADKTSAALYRYKLRKQ